MLHSCCSSQFNSLSQFGYFCIQHCPLYYPLTALVRVIWLWAFRVMTGCCSAFSQQTFKETSQKVSIEQSYFQINNHNYYYWAILYRQYRIRQFRIFIYLFIYFSGYIFYREGNWGRIKLSESPKLSGRTVTVGNKVQTRASFQRF